MIKNLVEIESKIGEWVGHLQLLNNTPADIAEQMLLQFLQIVGKIKEQAQVQPPKEEVSPAQQDDCCKQEVPEPPKE